MCNCNASQCAYCGVSYTYLIAHECEGVRLKAELDKEARV